MKRKANTSRIKRYVSVFRQAHMQVLRSSEFESIYFSFSCKQKIAMFSLIHIHSSLLFVIISDSAYDRGSTWVTFFFFRYLPITDVEKHNKIFNVVVMKTILQVFINYVRKFRRQNIFLWFFLALCIQVGIVRINFSRNIPVVEFSAKECWWYISVHFALFWAVLRYMSYSRYCRHPSVQTYFKYF